MPFLSDSFIPDGKNPDLSKMLDIYGMANPLSALPAAGRMSQVYSGDVLRALRSILPNYVPKPSGIPIQQLLNEADSARILQSYMNTSPGGILAATGAASHVPVKNSLAGMLNQDTQSLIQAIKDNPAYQFAVASPKDRRQAFTEGIDQLLGNISK